MVTHHQLSRSQRPKQFPPYFTDSSASLPGREGIATQGDHREDRVSEGPGRDLENRDGGSGRENLGRGQRLDRVTVRRTGPTIYWAMPFLSQIIYPQHILILDKDNDDDLLLSNDDDDE